jgi:hypothetical protein
LVFAFMPKEFDSFEVNYNLYPREVGYWEAYCNVCVQQEEKPKGSYGDSVNYVKQNKKWSYLDKNDKSQGKP